MIKNKTKRDLSLRSLGEGGELSTGLALLGLTISVVGLIVGFNLAITQPQTNRSEAFSLPSPNYTAIQNSAVSISGANIVQRSGSSTQYILNGTICFNSAPPNNSSFWVKVGRNPVLGSSVIRQIGNGNLVKCGTGNLSIGAVFSEPSGNPSTFSLSTYEVWVNADWGLNPTTFGSIGFQLPDTPTPAASATPQPTRDPNATNTPTPSRTPTPLPSPIPSQTPTPSPIPPGPISGTVTVDGADDEYDYVRVVKCTIKDINLPLIEPDVCNWATGNLKTSFKPSYQYAFAENDDPNGSFIVYAQVTKGGVDVKLSSRAIDCPNSPRYISHDYMCIVHGNSHQNFRIRLNGGSEPPDSSNAITINIRLYNWGSLKINKVNARLCLVGTEATCGNTVSETVPDNILKPGNGQEGINNSESYGRWLDGVIPKVNATDEHFMELWATFEGDKEGVKRVTRTIRVSEKNITIAQSAVALWHSGVVGDTNDLKLITAEADLADVDGNGCVNARDFSRIVSHYYNELSPSEYSSEDVNLDGIVNGIDLSYIYPNWLAGNCRLETPIPSP